MTEQLLMQLIAAYGASWRRWPEGEREAARRLLDHRPDLAARLQAERDLDDLMDAAPRLQPSMALHDQVLASAIQAGERDPALLEETSALGRMITVEDIAEAVCFLASDAARVITGIDLPVDAGWLVAPSWASYGGLPPARGNAA